jgi:hypothetical protein
LPWSHLCPARHSAYHSNRAEYAAKANTDEHDVNSMLIGNISRAVAATLAALAIAGPATAFTVDIDTGGPVPTGIVLDHDAGMSALRGTLPLLSYPVEPRDFGEVLVAPGTLDPDAAAQGQSSFHTMYVPGPSTALLMVVGLTVTSAHLQRRRAG